MSYLQEFQKIIEKNDYPKFLKLWEEYCYSDEPDEEECKKILAAVKASTLAKSFGQHVSRALMLWNKLAPSVIKDDIFCLIFDIQTTNSDDLAETALLYLQEKYPNDPEFEHKIHLVGLETQDNFQGAISHFALLTHLQQGNFVFHTAGWGTGEIIEISSLREEVSIEFEYVLGLKHLSYANAMKTLVPLSKQHFLARRFGNPDQLEQEAKNNPTAVVRMLLKDLGPKTAIEIKEELMDLVIPEQDWSRWWQTARTKLKKDTQVETPKTTAGKFSLLSEEISHEESLYKSLDTKPSIEQTIQIIYSFFRDFPQSLKNPDFQATLTEKIKKLLTFDLSIEQKLQIYFLQEDVTGEKNYQSLLQEIQNFPEFLEKIEILSLKKRLLIEIHKIRKDWKEIFLQLLFPINQNPLREYIFTELQKVESPTTITNKIQELLQHPLTYPHAFVWYFTKIKDVENVEELPFTDIEGKKRFFESFLILLDHLTQKDQYKDLVKKMTSLITSNKFKMVQHFMGKSSLEEVKEYLLLVSKCQCLTSHDKKIITSLAEVTYPSLKQKPQPANEKQNYIWTTEQGYKEMQKKIQNLAEVEIIKNAKEIEEARAHGDLRENAEYKAALEKRSQIEAQLHHLCEQMQRARIINKNEISTEKVGIGNIVTCENDNQEKIQFIILGPWDADVEKNILSFESQLAQVMTGLSIGDKFRFHGEEFTIKKIQNYFS